MSEFTFEPPIKFTERGNNYASRTGAYSTEFEILWKKYVQTRTGTVKSYAAMLVMVERLLTEYYLDNNKHALDFDPFILIEKDGIETEVEGKLRGDLLEALTVLESILTTKITDGSVSPLVGEVKRLLEDSEYLKWKPVEEIDGTYNKLSDYVVWFILKSEQEELQS